ncbi:acetyl-CoA C-acetyltransferase [Evansella sp. AB-P1]|uniref:acetyl-CoA C-acetyltransferase n=1 Tax=Evansella sp. AB-P1 TaxID=3037653 RepID=UPI00241D639F|nr:acetyl-CoA C-acetyltransferase [Evansella sp. AB-P1]MDG5788859.1 acetyl-CoA C-acetyltransferase [Evansella sp. AB-P1]
MNGKDIVLIEGSRTAFGEYCGSFSNTTSAELGAFAAKEAMKRSTVEPEEIDHVVFGNVMQSHNDAHVFARHVGLKAGVPIEVPALTINRLCGSGLESILTGCRYILTGEANAVLCGGAENLTQVPHVIRGLRSGLPLGAAPMEDWLWESFHDSAANCKMAHTAENLAKKYGITREEVDSHALSSHDRALAAIEKGYIQEEIVPVEVKVGRERKVVEKDEHPRKTSMQKLGKLKARFAEDGVVTPGNASGINDGGVAVVIASNEYAEKRGLKPIARLVSHAVVGVDPTIMGIGPVPAIRAALEKGGMTMADLDLVEINEAFSAQYLACQKELEFDSSIGNVNGGAVAFGHPLAASGARITLTLAYELRRQGKKYGVSSACIGGGQGIAAIWERL